MSDYANKCHFKSLTTSETCWLLYKKQPVIEIFDFSLRTILQKVLFKFRERG